MTIKSLETGTKVLEYNDLSTKKEICLVSIHAVTLEKHTLSVFKHTHTHSHSMITRLTHYPVELHYTNTVEIFHFTQNSQQAALQLQVTWPNQTKPKPCLPQLSSPGEPQSLVRSSQDSPENYSMVLHRHVLRRVLCVPQTIICVQAWTNATAFLSV